MYLSIVNSTKIQLFYDFFNINYYILAKSEDRTDKLINYPTKNFSSVLCNCEEHGVTFACCPPTLKVALRQKATHVCSTLKVKASVKQGNFFPLNVTVVVDRTGKYGCKNMQAAAYRKPPKEEDEQPQGLFAHLSHLASFVQREKLIAAFFLHTN